MSIWPEWARRQMAEQKLKHVLNSPYADQDEVAAAKEAILRKLHKDEVEHRLKIQAKVDRYESVLDGRFK